MTPHITSKRLSSDKISHGFFGREGGVSTGTYESLNAGFGSDDAPENVTENRRRIAQSLGGRSERFVSNHQIHGVEVRVLDETSDFTKRIKADGMVTKTPGILLSALHADCAPVLFHDPVAGVIGACHAGWRGAVAGITQETVMAMLLLGAKCENIIASIGPTISLPCYQVGQDWVDNAARIDRRVKDFTRVYPQQGPHFNLPHYLKMRLEQAAITVDIDTALCTYSEGGQEPDYFSYRRNTHLGISDYGRNIAAIMIK